MAEKKKLKKIGDEKFLELYEALENDDLIGSVGNPDFVKSIKGTKLEPPVKNFNKAFAALEKALSSAGLFNYEKYDQVSAKLETKYNDEEAKASISKDPL